MATIRPATPDDVDDLIRLRLALKRHIEASNPYVWRIIDECKECKIQQVNEMLWDDDGEVLIAEGDGGVIGFAWGHIEDRTRLTPTRIGFINLLYVDAGYRRQGIGTHLVEELCSYFKDWGVEQVSINYIRGNLEAEAFWGKLGFVPVRVSSNIPLSSLKRSLDNR
ncbi:MAG: N-acetyltransferase family protein [Candidatus Bathyarchaeia archaeon]